MKTIYQAVLVFSLFIFSIELYAQEIKITKKDGSIISDKVVATSSTSIFVSNQTISVKEISKVDVLSSGPDADSFLVYLSKVGLANENMSPIILNPDSGFTLKELNIAIEDFRAERQLGKGMQMLGILATAGSVILGGKKGQSLAIGGGLVSTIGFVIDLGAGRHLKRKG
jgi:hypothetical protein